AEPEPQRSEVEGDETQPISVAVAQAPAGQPLPANPPPQRTPAQPGAVFSGESQPNVGTVLQELSKMSAPAQAALNEMQKVLDRFEKMTPLMEETLRVYRDLGRDTDRMLPDLRRTNDEIQVTARNWSKLGERLDVLVQTNQDKLIKTLDNLND